MIKIVANASILFGLFLAGVCFFVLGVEQAFSCLLGSAMMLINLLGLWILWTFIFSKKSIALAVLVIIFKYLILGLILWNLNQIQWMRPVGFIIGLSSLLLGVISAIIFKKLKSEKTKV